MNTVPSTANEKSGQSVQAPWQEPAIAFERSLMAEAQGGPGPHGSPSGLLGPLAASGSTTTSTC